MWRKGEKLLATQYNTAEAVAENGFLPIIQHKIAKTNRIKQ